MSVISELFSLYTFIDLLFDIAVIFIFSVYCVNRMQARQSTRITFYQKVMHMQQKKLCVVDFIHYFAGSLGTLVFRWTETRSVGLNSPFRTQFSSENKMLARDFIFKIQTNSVSLQIKLPVNFHLYLLPPLAQCETLQSSYLLPKKSFQIGLTSVGSQLEGLVNLGHLIPISWHNLKCQKFGELTKFTAKIFQRYQLL